MQSNRLFIFHRLLLAFLLVTASTSALAATEDFALTATDVTMPSNRGAGISYITLTSLNGYSGTIIFDCKYAGTPTAARLPICSGYTQPVYQLQADAPLKTGKAFYPYGSVIPLSLPQSLPRNTLVPVGGLLLSGTLLLGFKTRRGLWRWLVLIALTTACIASVSACGGGSVNGTTPGNYLYVITAMDSSTKASVSTVIHVTVP